MKPSSAPFFSRVLTTPQIIVFSVTLIGVFAFSTVVTASGEPFGGQGFPVTYIVREEPGASNEFHSIGFLLDVAFAVVVSSLVFWVPDGSPRRR